MASMARLMSPTMPRKISPTATSPGNRRSSLRTETSERLSSKDPRPTGGHSRCPGRDLNPHVLADTSPSNWRVSRFRHLGLQQQSSKAPATQEAAAKGIIPMM